MTIFGPDISSYQSGLDLGRLGSASFVIAKTTEGTYYTDAELCVRSASDPSNQLQLNMGTPICVIDGCNTSVLAKGLCGGHYSRVLAGKDPRAGGPIGHRLPRDSSVEDRFWAKVNKDGPLATERPELGACWVWTASIKPNGYGQFNAGLSGNRNAHRYAYELSIGEIPAGHQLDHLCRNRGCVRPDHLEPVTQQENLRRGFPGAHQRAKTHCPAGHPYEGDNLLLHTRRDGGVARNCRECANASHRRRYHAKRALA